MYKFSHIYILSHIKSEILSLLKVYITGCKVTLEVKVG